MIYITTNSYKNLSQQDKDSIQAKIHEGKCRIVLIPPDPGAVLDSIKFMPTPKIK